MRNYIRNGQSLQVCNEVWECQNPRNQGNPLNILRQVGNRMAKSPKSHVRCDVIEQKAYMRKKKGRVWYLSLTNHFLEIEAGNQCFFFTLPFDCPCLHYSSSMMERYKMPPKQWKSSGSKSNFQHSWRLLSKD